jgi:hypothetical protein
VKMVSAFWDVAPCSLVETDRRFRCRLLTAAVVRVPPLEPKVSLRHMKHNSCARM